MRFDGQTSDPTLVLRSREDDGDEEAGVMGTERVARGQCPNGQQGRGRVEPRGQWAMQRDSGERGEGALGGEPSRPGLSVTGHDWE